MNDSSIVSAIALAINPEHQNDPRQQNTSQPAQQHYRDERESDRSNQNQRQQPPSKRKRDAESAEAGDGSGAQGDKGGNRSKRSRYISIACNECKRRKIKCNGENPCARCGNLSLECVYAPNCCTNNFKDSPEYKNFSDQMSALQAQTASMQNQLKNMSTMQTQVDTLQAQVNFLLSNLNALRSSIGQETFTESEVYTRSQVKQALTSAVVTPQPTPIDPMLQQGGPSRHAIMNQPRFQGPTSPAFSLGLARSSLQSMGITGAEDAADEYSAAQENLPIEAPRPPQPPAQKPVQDPLMLLSKDEVQRLCSVYEDEIGVMNPIVDISQVKSQASFLYTLWEKHSHHLPTGAPPMGIKEEGNDILRLILAIGLVAEGYGQSELGQKLFDSVDQAKNFRMVNSPTMKDVRVVVLMAIYHFHVDNEGLAWRVIGLAARLSLEMGLHRNITHAKYYAVEPDRSNALRLFWSIYVLDRRWSYGIGRGFALQETDIDPLLPRPTDSPYLSAMILFSTILTRSWKFINVEANGTDDTSARREIEYLDYEFIQWHRNLPEQFKYIHPAAPEFAQHASDPNEAESRVLYRLRVILYLRCNQARLSIYRPILSSATSILTGDPSFAQTPVDVAKDTIRILHHVNQTSDIYRTAQMTFNYFLLSALAVLFLAVAHAPAQFAEFCREEFHIALELVRGLSTNSYVCKRLWRTIRNMKEVGPKIGLYTPAEPNELASGATTHAHNSLHTTRENSVQHRTPQPPNSSFPPPRYNGLYPPPRYPQHSLQGLPESQLPSISAALAMTDFAANAYRRPSTAHEANVLSPLRPDFVPSPNTNMMANDLENIFEAAGMFATTPAAQATIHAAASARGNGGAVTGTELGIDVKNGRADGREEEELNKVMGEMF